MWFLEFIIILVILAAMILVLLGIAQLGRHESYDNIEETELLKNEVSDNDNVITKNSVFKNLIKDDEAVPDIQQELIKEKRETKKEFPKDHRF